MAGEKRKKLTSGQQLDLARKLRAYEKKNPGALKDDKKRAQKIAIFVSETREDEKT